MKRKKNYGATLVIAGLLAILGLGGVVTARMGGSSVLGEVIQLLELAKELNETPANKAGDELLGLVTTADDVQTANFNNLALATNVDNSGYINAIFEYMDTTTGAASTTPISIKNTWGQDVIAEWALIFPVGTPTTSIRFYSGTSTLSGIGYNVSTALPNCLISDESIV